jgi:hypothetical protein
MFRFFVLAFVLPAAGPSTAPLPPEYTALHAKAIAENRPLIVWVGLVRPDIEAVRPDALHLRCANFPDATAPCVVVSRPAKGELWRIIDLPAARADALKPTLRRVCGPGGCTYSSVLEY